MPVVPLRPIAHRGLTVVRLGEDVGHPSSGQRAVGEPLVEVVAAEVAIEELGHMELLQDAEEHR